MDLSVSVLGANVVRELQTRQAAPILRIGSDTFTRASLAKVACFNFIAAHTLSTILNREFNVKNLREVFEHVAPDRLVLPRLGAVALAVLGAAFEAKGIGGDAPLENWMKRHREGTTTTFATLKHRFQHEERIAAKALQERKHARRNKAHKIRVERFSARQQQEGNT
jgi:hypothetical protein